MQKYFSRLLLLSAALICPFSVLAASPVQTEVSAGYTYDDNVTRAELDRDIEKDDILNLDAAARYKIPANDISYFSVKGTLELNKYREFDKLSNNRLGIHGSYHIKPFSGYTATRFFVLGSYERRFYQSDQRDGSAVLFQLGLDKRLTDVVTIRAGFIKEKVDAAESKGVFDADNNRFYLDADFKWGSNNTVYLTLSRFKGDIVSTTVPTSKIVTAARPYIVRDDAFLELTPDRYAYKLDATTDAIKLGDNYSIDSNQAIDISIFYYDAAATYGNDYTGTIFNMNYLYRF